MNALHRAEIWRSAMPRLTFLPLLESALAVLAILLFSQALLGPLLVDPLKPDAAEALRLVWLPVYGVTLLVIAMRPLAVLETALRAWPLMLLALLAALSTFWSIDPDITSRRALALAMTTLFGLWLASRFDWKSLLTIIAVSFAILMAGSAIAGALVPGFGVMQEVHPGAWRGLWWEKNTLGAMMGWAVLAFVGAAAFDTRRRMIWLALVVPALALVVLSTSRTAMLASFIAIAGPGMIALARRDAASSAIAVMAGVVGASLGILVLVIGPGVLLEALGRDATFTGRTEIWEALFRQIGERPLLGFGYGVFWQVDLGPAYWVRLETNWPVPTAHNGWIETALATGLIGVGVAAIAYAGALGSAALRLFRGNETYWALPFLVMWGLISFSESNLAEQNSLMWVMFTATAAKLAQPREAAP